MLRVLQLLGPHVQVPAPGHGGTERVVESLATHLPAAQVEVTTFTVGRSRLPGAVASHFDAPPERLDAHGVRSWDRTDDLIQAGKAFQLAPDFDLVHLHTEYGLPFAAVGPVPALATLHSYAGEGGGLERLVDAFPDTPSVAISANQRSLCGHLTVVATILHCIPEDVLCLAPRPGVGGDHLLYLGEMTVRKGADLAVRAARRAGLPLVLAGPVSRSNRDWFDTAVAPHVDGRSVTWVGDVAGRAKAELLDGAAALLCPVRWQEPFGLVAVEAMAMGTPVVALRRGALPEIVEDGVTGYTVPDATELADRCEAAARLDRAACAARARTRFDPAVMAARYVEAYTRVVAQWDGH